MKDASKMNGPVVGHYGEEIKILKYQEVIFPDFTILYKGPEGNSGYYDFTVGPIHSDVGISLSRGKGLGMPLSFQFQDKQVSILAIEPDAETPDEIIIKLVV